MKLIIDIDEEDYKGICHLKNEQLRMLPVEVAETLIRIANGIPLPKGHGRLIDADEIMCKVDVLDNLRTEIEQITDTMGVSYNQYVSKIDVLQIIDKYRAESEE